MSRLLAISDIHGCFDTFYELVINRLRLTRSDKLCLLGDYIDRGPSSRQVVDLIIDLMEKNFNVVALTGNHEAMMLDAFNDDEMLPLWLLNSGLTTIKSLNINSIGDVDTKYINFFKSLKYFEKEGDNIFVHAGFNDNSSDPFSDTDGMIWQSYTSYNNPELRGKRIIHGHRPKTIEHVKKLISGNSLVIPIDTGCVYDREDGYGFLSALEINAMELISIERTDTIYI